MTKRVVIASLVASVLMFVWGFLFWGLLMVPEKMGMMQPLPGDADGNASETIKGLNLESGVYVYPWCPAHDADEAAQQAFVERYREGPIFQLFYNAAGKEPMAPIDFVKGWLHGLVIALLAGVLLCKASAALPTYGSRFCFVLMMSLLAAIWTNGSNAIWFGHLKYSVGNAAYELGAGALMAMVLACKVKQPKPAE